MRHIVVETANSGLWFSVIYMLTVILSAGIFCVAGLRQKRAFLTIWFLTLAGLLFFLAGIHLFTMSPNEISAVLFSGDTPVRKEMSVVGGFMVLPGFMIAILWLRERISLADNLAIPFVAGVGIQNIGCFKAGCCYGNPCGLPWSVQYAAHSPAFNHELEFGLLREGENLSLPLHPVQLYLFAGCMLIAFLLWRFRKNLKAPLSTFLLGWVLYALLRFLVEFLRDPATNHGLGNVAGGLKILQWILLGNIMVFGLVVYLREHYLIKQNNLSVPQRASHMRFLTLLFFLTVLSIWFGSLFGFIEKLIIQTSLSVAMLLLGWDMLWHYTTVGYRLAICAGILGGLVLMGQGYLPEYDKKKTTYTEIGGGVQISRFYQNVSTYLGQYEGTDCDGNTVWGPNYRYNGMRHNGLTGSLTIKQNQVLGLYDRFGYGISLTGGADKVAGTDTLFSKKLPIVSVRPFLSYDSWFFGFSAGFLAGRYHFATINHDQKSGQTGQFSDDIKKQHLWPSLSVRIGPSDIAYVEGYVADHIMSASPMLPYGLNIGSGLGRTDGTNVAVGISTELIYLKAYLPVKENYYVSSFFGWWTEDNLYSGKGLPANSNSYQFSLGLHYRFNYKEIPGKP